jgi:D-threo-aldose 1-dehydrogenase
VPPLAVGCAPLANMPETFGYGVDEARALATVHAALAGPFPYLDTAAGYGDGASERRIGLVLRELGGLPAEAVLQTKIGAGPGGHFSGETVRRRFERSLSLLGLERVEVVFLHDPENASAPPDPVESAFAHAMAPGGPVEALRDLQAQGLIGHLGVAGGTIALLHRLIETGLFAAVITHNRYTLLNRSADPLITFAAERGLAVLNAAPYGSGLLAKGADSYPRYAYSPASAKLVERTRLIEAICARYGVPLAAAALQFSLHDPRLAATIVGLSRPERVAETATLASQPIPAACWAELRHVPYAVEDLARA